MLDGNLFAGCEVPRMQNRPLLGIISSLVQQAPFTHSATNRISVLKVTSCNSLAEIFERLDGLPNAKKDGSSLAGKVIQPVLKLLNEDSSEEVWEAAVQLLCTIFDFLSSISSSVS